MISLNHWLRAIRLPTLTASVIPVTLGGILALQHDHISIINLVLAAEAMTFFQITSNLINDVDDFNNGVDTKESLGSSKVVVDGLLTQKQLMIAAKVFFLIAVATGTYLTLVKGLVIGILGLIGAVSAYFYTRKPFCFKYKGYGVPLVFMMFGPLPVLGSYYLSSGIVNLKPILLSVPIGLLTTAILHANDLRDIEHDARAGIKSFAMVLGSRRSRIFYLLLILFSFISVTVFVLLGLVPYLSLIVFLAAPTAVMLIRISATPGKLRTLDQKTAGLQLMFGLLLLISILL